MFPRLLPAIFAACCLTLTAAAAQRLPDPRADLRSFLGQALTAICTPDALSSQELAWRLGGAFLIDERVFEARGRRVRWQRRYQLLSGDELAIMRLGPGGRLRRLSLELYSVASDGRPRPEAMALAGGNCRIVSGAKLHHDAEGRQESLERWGPDLEPTGVTEPLNPPMPAGPPTPPEAVRVALFDSGLNYALPAVAARLAYDADGRALGFDFWERDARPFDAHPVASPFLPLRHGTPVASLILREAPEAFVVPFRYPRPDMGRMTDMVAAAEAAGALIVSMPMGSNRRADWSAFAEAAAVQPEILFVVSAGNNGRDIDEAPVFPAALPLENLLVVTSSDDAGRLARGSNWGPRSVDLMVPAEGLAVMDFSGAEGRGSGSSYAVPRVAALAARLLARHPDWRAAELKAAILERAMQPPGASKGLVKSGWLPSPQSD